MNKTIFKFIVIFSVLTSGLVPAPYSSKAKAVENNLVSNPSVEQIDSTTNIPVGWKNGNWGSNITSYSVNSIGYNSDRSLRVDITNYQDGDAKWYFDKVTVDPTKKYIFSDYYQSNIYNEVVAELTDLNNNVSYQWMGGLQASTDWTRSSFEFDVPAGTAYLTIYHLINSNGFLTTDSYTINEVVNENATITDNVPNNSLEQINYQDNSPLSWNKNSWGTNTASFEYLNTGHTGSKSAKTIISDYTSGDAKWYFTPQQIVGGKTYQFADYYQSSIPSQVILMITKSDGSVVYQELKSTEPASDWKEYSDNFNIATDVSNISVLHVISASGFLITDDYSIKEVIPENVIYTDNVPNAGAEQVSANSNLPLAWNSNSWGTNTATFEYLDTGYSGAKSLKTSISGYTDGDAKWYFNKIALNPARYTFSDYYKSDVASDIVAEFEDQNGNISYQWLGTFPLSSEWAEASVSFDLPSTAKYFAIFHLISQNGFLITDDYSIKKSEDRSPDLTIPNGNVEEVSTTDIHLPSGWSTDKWGTNTASFEYLNTGYNSNRSLKTTISAYTRGDAKWYFNHQNVIPGTTYQFSNYYQSDIPSQVTVEIIKEDGNYDYLNLKVAEASATWQKYTDTFSIPLGVSQITIFHFISAVGFLVTDNYSINSYQPTSFSRPIVSLTFDDGWEDNVTTALPVMTQYGFRSTQYYATTFINNNQAEAAIKIGQFVLAGHEIGSHSITHPDLTTLSEADLIAEIASSKATLEGIAGLGNIKAFATPFGAYNANVVTKILEYYESHRSTDVGLNTKDTANIDNIRVKNMLYSTTLAEYQSWIDQAVRDNAWLVLVYHRVADNPGAYDSYISDFAAQMQYVNNSGITVLPVSEALTEITTQITL